MSLALWKLTSSPVCYKTQFTWQGRLVPGCGKNFIHNGQTICSQGRHWPSESHAGDTEVVGIWVMNVKVKGFKPPFPRHNKANCAEKQRIPIYWQKSEKFTGFLTKQLFIFLSWETHIIIKYYIGKLLGQKFSKSTMTSNKTKQDFKLQPQSSSF